MPLKRQWVYVLSGFLIFFSLLSVFHSDHQYLGRLKGVGLGLVKAPLAVGTRVINNVYAFLKSPHLMQENKELKASIERLQLDRHTYREVFEENKRLRDALDIQTALPFHTVVAQVIGGSPDTLMRSFIIDKGTKAGIAIDNPVIAHGGLLGRVIEAGPFTSKIILLTNPNVKVSARLQRSRYAGLLIGDPDGRCRLHYLALDVDILPGDIVITAGLGTIFPKGLILGMVEQVYPAGQMPFRTALIRLQAMKDRVEEVICIISDTSKPPAL